MSHAHAYYLPNLLFEAKTERQQFYHHIMFIISCLCILIIVVMVKFLEAYQLEEDYLSSLEPLQILYFIERGHNRSFT